MSSLLRFNSISIVRVLILVLALPFSIPAYSVSFESGDLYGSLDTTVSFGRMHRTQKSAAELIGIANGGTANSVNGDDGNLNYNDVGVVSNTMKFTTELELNYKNFGTFIRGTGFKDTQANDIVGDSERTSLSDTTIRLNGENISLLDAYVWGDFEIGNMPLTLRVGEQVISWGESTFIQNSINVINPVDVSKLRVPGAELKEALIPVGIVSASLGVTDNLELEAYWQYDYERIQIDPAGSYFSTNDFVGAGGSFVVAAGAGTIPDYLPLGPGGTLVPNVNIFPVLPTGFAASRAPDARPDQGDEYGIALRYYSPELNDTEFGLYHIKYHSRLPIINGVVSTAGFGFTGAQYLISYPEDIKLYGLSFNTQLGTSGWALQGEYSFRDDAPLQIDDVEILAATLNLGIPNQVNTAGAFGLAPGEVIPGFIKRDISQFQMTATKIFSNVFKADQAVLLAEAAVTHVHNMPSKSVLRLETPGTYVTGNAANVGALLHPFVEPDENYPDSTSWGYRIVGRMTYNNAIGPINLSPRVGWRHDVRGITPGPAGNFLEGRKQVTVGIGADYQNSWRADLSYTSFFGAGRLNLLSDRDFAAFSMSYSF